MTKDRNVKLTSNDVGADPYLSVMTEHKKKVIIIQTLWLSFVQVLICNRQSANTPAELFTCVHCAAMHDILKMNWQTHTSHSVTEHKILNLYARSENREETKCGGSSKALLPDSTEHDCKTSEWINDNVFSAITAWGSWAVKTSHSGLVIALRL